MRRRVLAAIVVLIGVLASGRSQAQQSHINGGDSARVGHTIVTHLAGRTLTIPSGYVSSLMGYAGNVQIRALLPCLLPETSQNTAEFHKTTFGRVLTANLNPFSDNPYRVGQVQLDEIIKLSAFAKSRQSDYAEFVKTYDPEHRDAAIGPNAVPGSKFVVYDDVLLKRDIFVLPSSVPLLVIQCVRHIGSVGHTGCDVHERALGNLYLWYWYDGGRFIDPDVDFAATIDARLQRLLESFLTARPKQTACDTTEDPSEEKSK
jgi:hypothetical protein